MRTSLCRHMHQLDKFPHTHRLWHQHFCLCTLAHKHCTHMFSFSHVISPPSSGALSHKHRHASYLLLHEKTTWTSCHYLIPQPKSAKYVPSQCQMPQSAFLAIHSSQTDRSFSYSLLKINWFATPSLLLSLPVERESILLLFPAVRPPAVQRCMQHSQGQEVFFAPCNIPQTSHWDQWAPQASLFVNNFTFHYSLIDECLDKWAQRNNLEKKKSTHHRKKRPTFQN